MRDYTIPLVKLSMVRDPSLQDAERIRCGADVKRIAAQMIGESDREVFLVFHLDNKNRVISAEAVSTGSLTMTLVHPREVFKAAILSNAASIIVAHNHPSGDPTPSREDRDITERLKSAGALLGIPLVDHVVIGANDTYRSFAESGLL